MSRFKDKINFGDEILNAAKRRITDVGENDYTEKEIDEGAVKYLTAHTEAITLYNTQQGTPLSSLNRAEELRDIKFSVEGLNRRTAVLEEKIGSFSEEVYSTLSNIQREVNALTSETSEQEIKILGEYDKVHLNSAVRGIDMPLSQDEDSWNKDFKTGFSFLQKNQMHPIVSAGFTLPIREQMYLPVISAIIIDEGTDTREAITPLISTPAENIFLPGKIFRHVIVRKDFDESSRLYKQETVLDEYPYSCVSSCSIQLELPNNVAINFIDVEPIAGSTVYISKIEYLNEAGEEIELTTSTLSSETNLYILFSPIYTRYLKITFEQYASLARTEVSTSDSTVLAINGLLEGAGFSQLLSENGELIKGRIYDFSMKRIRVGFIVYENLGVFRSKPILVESPLSIELSIEVESILPPSEKDPYGNLIATPEGRLLYETYVGARLETGDGNVRLNSLIPVPDSYPWQTEFLFPIGSIAKVKLFPDLGLLSQVDSIEVYNNTQLLSLGSEYEISLDAESTWFSTIPAGTVYNSFYKDPVAGNFRIRFFNKDPAALYWIKYRVLRNQKLLSDDFVYLQNGHVLFRRQLEPVHGTLNTIVVFRTNTLYPYVTSILREYSLKIQQFKGLRRFFGLPSSRVHKNSKRIGSRGMHVTQRS